MNDWNIQSRARACQACSRAFADKETYHTVLFEVRSGFDRQDVCPNCWEQQYRHGATDKKGFISHWQGQFLLPPPRPPEPIHRDNAEALLRRLIERNNPAWQPAAFILAVMLERKRVLKTREQIRHAGGRTLVYELPATGELFTVPDPVLRLDQLEQVQRDVAHLLEHGLPVEGSPVEEPFAPEMTDQPSLAHPAELTDTTAPPTSLDGPPASAASEPAAAAAV